MPKIRFKKKENIAEYSSNMLIIDDSADFNDRGILFNLLTIGAEMTFTIIPIIIVMIISGIKNSPIKI